MDRSKYIKEVRANLNCSGAKKTEICNDIETDINIAVDGGEEESKVLQQMGNPVELAKEFNLNMGLPAEKKSKKKIWIIVITVILVIAACIFVLQSRVPRQYEMGKSGIFTEEAVSRESRTIVDLLYAKDIEGVLNQFGADELKEQLSSDKLTEAMDSKGHDWGKFKKIQNQYFVETKQNGQFYAVTEITVLYENVSVTYTLSFDEDMKLAGLFIK